MYSKLGFFFFYLPLYSSTRNGDKQRHMHAHGIWNVVHPTMVASYINPGVKKAHIKRWAKRMEENTVGRSDYKPF